MDLKGRWFEVAEQIYESWVRDDPETFDPSEEEEEALYFCFKRATKNHVDTDKYFPDFLVYMQDRRESNAVDRSVAQ